MKVKEFLLSHKSKTITERELIEALKSSYEKAAASVKELVKQGVLEPIRASKTNGRIPALYNKYRIKKTQKDYSKTIGKIKLLHPNFDHQAYFNDPELYEINEGSITALSYYFWHCEKELETPMSVNERSFRIWGREKYLKEHLIGLSGFIKLRMLSDNEFIPEKVFKEILNFYSTPEPFFDYVHEKKSEMNVLIIENKDTWYSLRKALKETGNNTIYGKSYQILLYGEGRKITRSTSRLEEYHNEILSNSKNTYAYFGDLDIEGLLIYCDLKRNNSELALEKCIGLYEAMITKARELQNNENLPYELPFTKDERRKNVNWDELLFGFTTEDSIFLRRLFENGYYIPQEILNYKLLCDLMKGNTLDV